MHRRFEEIPTEIWLAIADAIRELDHNEARDSEYGPPAVPRTLWEIPRWAQNIMVSSSRLAALSSTCRQLRNTLGPKYFETLTLKRNDPPDPYAIFLRIAHKIMRPEFESLRGFVKEIYLDMTSNSITRPYDMYKVVETIPMLLSQFPRLESLRLEFVLLLNPLLHTLFSLPIKSLHMLYCTMLSEPESRWPTRTTTSRLQRFCFFENYGAIENVCTWVEAMLVPSLTEVYVSAPVNHVELAQLPNLRRLKVSTLDFNNNPVMSCIPVDFGAASSLEELLFEGPGTALVCHVPLANLKKVACLPEETSWLIKGRPVTEAEIYSINLTEDTQDWKDTLAALTSGSVPLRVLKMGRLLGVPGDVIAADLAAKLPMLVHLELPTDQVDVIKAMISELARFEYLEHLCFGSKTEAGIDLEDQKDVITLLSLRTKSKGLSEISFSLRFAAPWHRNGSAWTMVYPSEPTVKHSLEVVDPERANGEDNEV